MLRRILTPLALAALLAGPLHAEELDDAERLLADGDAVAAFEAFERLAIGGDLDAQVRLAQLYASGRGTDQDMVQAARWYERAADAGHPNAQFALGMLYATGSGVAADDGVAVDWYVRAAKQGHVEAQYNLGYMYANGRGMERDQTRARVWYQLAADQNHTQAQVNLAGLYARGDGVERDEAKAAEWYRKAAALGDPDAQFSLGYLHETGRGVPRDPGEALRLYAMAAGQGNGDAEERLRALRGDLAAAQERRVVVEKANLRTGPGTGHDKLDQLELDDTVTELRRDGDWVEVLLPGPGARRGWLHANLLDGPPAGAAAEPADAGSTDAATTPVVAAAPPPEPATATAAPARPPAATGTPPAPAAATSAQAALVTEADAARGELRETLEERDDLLQRLASLTRQTEALSQQIKTMEQQRGKPAPAAPARETPKTGADAGSVGGLFQDLGTLLDRLDGRLAELDRRLRIVETNQQELVRQVLATRQTQLTLAQTLEQQLVTLRIKAVEAETSEVGAKLALKESERKLAASENRALDLERQIANRAADRAEQTQRLITLEEERDALMHGLDSAERRLADLREQLTGDDPPRVTTQPLKPAAQ